MSNEFNGFGNNFNCIQLSIIAESLICNRLHYFISSKKLPEYKPT